MANFPVFSFCLFLSFSNHECRADPTPFSRRSTRCCRWNGKKSRKRFKADKTQGQTRRERRKKSHVQWLCATVTLRHRKCVPKKEYYDTQSTKKINQLFCIRKMQWVISFFLTLVVKERVETRMVPRATMQKRTCRTPRSIRGGAGKIFKTCSCTDENTRRFSTRRG
jgi:hypothetical protein